MTEAAHTPAKTTKSFSKIFDADVTFTNSVSSRTDSRDAKYKISQGASIVMPNGDVVSRTVMGFGKQIDGIKNLAKGRTVRLSIQRDGGVMKIVGLPRAAAA